MYRLLIVDDEPVIANALYEVFQNLKQLELDVCRVYSGNAALELLRTHKIDIVLSDIRMPGIDGIQLLGHIHASWPQCRVILLTGYNEFDYVYSAIQYKNVSYLLKTEGYDKVITAVETAARDIDRSLVMEDLLSRANQQLVLTSALLQKEYFMELLKGKAGLSDVSPEQFRQLGIGLDAGTPLWMLVGRMDNLPDRMSYTDRSRSMMSVRLIAEEFLQPLTVSVCIADENLDFIWLLQPRESGGDMAEDVSCNESWDRVGVFIREIPELIQNACHESLSLSLSFALNSQPVRWKELSDRYVFLKQLLDYRIGSGTGMLLVDRNMAPTGTASTDSAALRLFSDSLRKLDSLVIYLERGQKNEFDALLQELTHPLLEIASMHYNPALELYYAISLKFLSYINQWDLSEKIAFSAGLSKLTRIELHDSWKDASDYLKSLSEILFAIQGHEQEKRAADTVTFILNYIDGHISQELSLVKLADLVYFNPSYLSRLFKQAKGENLSEYILGKRIEKAKLALENPEIRILEVAEEVGYPIAQNFSRFFKKYTGMTPQEYRDAHTSKRMI